MYLKCTLIALAQDMAREMVKDQAKTDPRVGSTGVGSGDVAYHTPPFIAINKDAVDFKKQATDTKRMAQFWGAEAAKDKAMYQETGPSPGLNEEASPSEVAEGAYPETTADLMKRNRETIARLRYDLSVAARRWEQVNARAIEYRNERDALAQENSGLLSQDLERRQQIDQMHQEWQDLLGAYKALQESQRLLIRSLE